MAVKKRRKTSTVSKDRMLRYRDKRIRYTIMKNRMSKHIRIYVQMGHFVKVTKPVYVSDREVEKFVNEKKDWIVDKMDEFRKYGSNKNLFVDSKEHFLQYKEKALAFCEERVAYWNRKLGFPVNTVRVKRVKSMWGSCSSEGNLTFNYKIIFIPKKAADSIIVHELCHLKEMNHSPQFWKLVNEVLHAG